MLAALVSIWMLLPGCMASSFFDPSVAGRWKEHPATLDIKTRIPEIEQPLPVDEDHAQVVPEDLLPNAVAPVLTPGDQLDVSVIGLLEVDHPWQASLRVDDVGNIRIPVAGVIACTGLTAPQLEDKIRQRLIDLHQIKTPMVSVIVTEDVSHVFSILGDPDTVGTQGSVGKAGGSGVGTYPIPRPDFHLLDALAKASGISGKVRRLYVIRPNPITAATSATLPASAATQPATAKSPAKPYRVIAVPYDQLLAGRMEFNLVIRPGDIIRIPPVAVGNVYIGGQVTKPGAYSLTGDQDMTLKQLIISAGGLSELGVPEHVDLIRRTSDNRESFVKVDMRAVFAGERDDVFLKPNDVVNVGTTFVAFPTAMLRNGMKTAYGFDAVQKVP